MSTRIKGNKLGLKLGTPAVDHWPDMIRTILENDAAAADVVTFGDAAAGGGRQYFLNVSAIQSTDPTSFWSLCWDKTGQEIPFTYAPHGNATPTAAQPHFIGVVKVGPRPPIGGEASATGRPYTWEGRWEVVGEPVKDKGTV